MCKPADGLRPVFDEITLLYPLTICPGQHEAAIEGGLRMVLTQLNRGKIAEFCRCGGRRSGVSDTNMNFRVSHQRSRCLLNGSYVASFCIIYKPSLAEETHGLLLLRGILVIRQHVGMPMTQIWIRKALWRMRNTSWAQSMHHFIG